MLPYLTEVSYSRSMGRSERGQPMYRRTGKHSLMVALLVTLVVLAVSACGGGQDEANKPRPLPEDEKALRPGEYRSEEFKPSLSFRVGEGWSTAAVEVPDRLAIVWGESDPTGDEAKWLFFANPQEAYKPSSATGLIEVVEAPDDIVGWLQKHPYFQTDEPKPVTVGGVKGQQLDVVVAKNSPANEINTFRYSDGTIGFIGKEHKERVIVLDDVEGETVFMGFRSLATEFDEFAPEAQKVIDTVKWEGS